MNDTEMRFNLFREAKEILYRNWQEKVDLERLASGYDKRIPNKINPPSLQRIMKVAEKLDEFIHRVPLAAK